MSTSLLYLLPQATGGFPPFLLYLHVHWFIGKGFEIGKTEAPAAVVDEVVVVEEVEVEDSTTTTIVVAEILVDLTENIGVVAAAGTMTLAVEDDLADTMIDMTTTVAVMAVEALQVTSRDLLLKSGLPQG